MKVNLKTRIRKLSKLAKSRKEPVSIMIDTQGNVEVYFNGVLQDTEKGLSTLYVTVKEKAAHQVYSVDHYEFEKKKKKDLTQESQ